jgi:hypothetical protein
MNPRWQPFISCASLLLAATALSAAEDFLEDATLLVSPGEDPASGLVAMALS